MKKEEKNSTEKESDIQSELKELKSELEKANKKLEEAENNSKETNDRLLRLAAEYDNFRKRAVKEKEEAYTDAYADAVKELLPVLDNLERAKDFAQDNEGLQMIFKQLEEAFDKLSVKEIPAQGLAFDPEFHNAVMIDEDSEVEANTVTAVLQKGYTVKDRIVRFAMVKVAK